MIYTYFLLQLTKFKKNCEKQGKELESCKEMIRSKDKSLEVRIFLAFFVASVVGEVVWAKKWSRVKK
jgi:hypothetical protein